MGDYWSGGTLPGLSQSWVFEGIEGLQRVTGPSRFTATDEAGFRARLTRVQFDHVAVEAFAATPHRSSRGIEQVQTHPTPLLTFVFVSDGSLHVELTDFGYELGSGQFAVFDSREPVTMTAPAEVRLLKSVVGVEHVPDYLQQRGTTTPGPLHRTTLTDSFVAFLSAVLRSSTIGRPAEGHQLVQAVADLQNAVLAEAQQILHQPTGPAGIRYRMEEYIETHLTDPGLSPIAVADALGISIRYAHTIFNDHVRTISRYIRDRRIARIALLLRTTTDRIELTELATRYGFPTAEAMSRAFHERLGMAPTDYRAESHRHLG